MRNFIKNKNIFVLIIYYLLLRIKNIFVYCYDLNKDRLTHQQLWFHPYTKELKSNEISLNTAWS